MSNYFSCYVDDKPIFKAQAYIWLLTLIDKNNVEPDSIFIHLSKDFDKKYLKQIKTLGVNIVFVNEFDSGNPYCNKLTQFDTPHS